MQLQSISENPDLMFLDSADSCADTFPYYCYSDDPFTLQKKRNEERESCLFEAFILQDNNSEQPELEEEEDKMLDINQEQTNQVYQCSQVISSFLNLDLEYSNAKEDTPQINSPNYLEENYKQDTIEIDQQLQIQMNIENEDQHIMNLEDCINANDPMQQQINNTMNNFSNQHLDEQLSPSIKCYQTNKMEEENYNLAFQLSPFTNVQEQQIIDILEQQDNNDSHQDGNYDMTFRQYKSICRNKNNNQRYQKNFSSDSNQNNQDRTSTANSTVSSFKSKSGEQLQKKNCEARKRNDESKGYHSKVFTVLKSMIKKEEQCLRNNIDCIILMKTFDTIIELQSKGGKQYLKYIQAILIAAKEIDFKNKYFKILYNSVTNKSVFTECYKEVLKQWEKETPKKQRQKQVDQDKDNVQTAAENTRWSLEKELNKISQNILDDILSNLLFSKKKQRDCH